MAHVTTQPQVTVGVDTHKQVHVAVARDQLGRRLAVTLTSASSGGYAELLAWARGLGEPWRGGVEGTGSYGAGPTRFLRRHGQRVVEVNRPDRAARRRRGKSDPVDADAAARAVQAGEATGLPKAQDGVVEMLRALRVARQTAVKARTQAINAIKGLLVTAPASLREQLEGLSIPKLVGVAAGLEPGALTTPAATSRLVLRSLAERYQRLDAEITTLTGELDRLTATHAPALRALFGVGPEVAAALLVTAGDNPGRLRSEAVFAALCGASPVEASSGTTRRHRLNRGGTGRPTRRCTGSWSSGCAGISPPATTSPGAPPRARAKRRSSAVSLAEYRWGDPEPWVMVPRLASGDGPVALPPDGQFQSCCPWRSEALQTGVRDLPRRGPNNEEPATGPHRLRSHH